MPSADSTSTTPYVPRKKRRKGKPTIGDQMRAFGDDGMGKHMKKGKKGKRGDFYVPPYRVRA